MPTDVALEEIAQDIIQSATTYSTNKRYMRYIEGVSDVTNWFVGDPTASVTTFDLGEYNLEVCHCCKKPLLTEKETGFFYRLNDDEAAFLINFYFGME